MTVNKFSSEQLDTIKDLAFCFWDANIRQIYPKLTPVETINTLRTEYAISIIEGLKNPAVWG